MVDEPDEKAADEELMQHVALGSRQAFEILIARHQRPILNFIFRFIGNRSDAEDLTQDVFLRVWENAGTYLPEARFTTWLYRIATNLCINLQRRNRIRRWFSASEKNRKEQQSDNAPMAGRDTTGPTPEDDYIQFEQSRHVRGMLNELPTSQRLAVILKVYEELSYSEISRILGRSPAAVDSLLIRAKRNLRKKINA